VLAEISKLSIGKTKRFLEKGTSPKYLNFLAKSVGYHNVNLGRPLWLNHSPKRAKLELLDALLVLSRMALPRKGYELIIMVSSEEIRA
jgi:hypothetical protein